MIEKREEVRKLLATEASIGDEALDVWRPIRLFDISKTGLAFLTTEEIVLNTVHAFRFCLPDSSRKMNSVAIVLHSTTLASNSGFRVGAKFLGIDEEDVALIKEYVESASGK